MKPGAPWGEAELAVLRKHYRSRGPRHCAQLLPARTESAIINRARILGLQRKRPGWRAKELKLLAREYPIGGLAGCAAVLPNRTETAIYQQAHNLGISAPPYPSLKKAVGEAAVLRLELAELREKLAAAEAEARAQRGRAAGLERELRLQGAPRPFSRAAA